MSKSQQAAVVDDQRELLARIERTTHWLKRKLDYRGSKQTEDFRAIATEKLLRSETYGPRFRESPRSLLPVVPKMMRNLILEYRRRGSRQKRAPAHLRVDVDQSPVAVSADGLVFAHDRQRALRLEAALGAFECGESGKRVRPENRPRMVAAFRLKLDGFTDAEVAEQLGVSKATINAWVQFMTAHLARELAEAEP